MPGLFPFIFALFIAAAFMNLDFIFYILYIFFGIYLLGKLWARQAMRAIRHRRVLPSDRAFLGEVLQAELEIVNAGLFPLPWVRLRDTLPLELHAASSFHRVISLLSHEHVTLAYQLHCRRRGYYQLGPLFVWAGDLFGVAQEVKQEHELQPLTVYPKIVPCVTSPFPPSPPLESCPAGNAFLKTPPG